MANATDYLEGQIITHLFRTGTFAKPSNLEIALSTTTINDDGTGITEPVGNGYTRITVAPSDANFTAPTSGNGRTENVNELAFPTATGSWGTIVDFAIFDQTGTNMLIRDSLNASVPVNNGDTAKFNPNALTVTVA